MKARKILVVLFFLGLAGAFGHQLSMAAGTEPVILRFNPPEGVTLREKSDRYVAENPTFPGERGSTNRITDITTWTFHRTLEGFRFVRVFKGQDRTIDGRPFKNPISPLMDGNTNILTISTAGILLRSEEDEHLAERVKAALPTNVWQEVDEQCNHEAWFLHEKALWEWNFSRFIGKPLRQGDIWRDQVKLSGPNVNPQLSTWFFLNKVDYIGPGTNGRLEVRIYTAYSTWSPDLDKLDTTTLGDTNGVRKFFEMEYPVWTCQRTSQFRTFDAETMRPTIDSRMSNYPRKGPHGLVWMKEVELRRYTIIH